MDDLTRVKVKRDYAALKKIENLEVMIRALDSTNSTPVSKLTISLDGLESITFKSDNVHFLPMSACITRCLDDLCTHYENEFIRDE